MASAQVKPISRKEEAAEAGRRKLEQFRKQKAAERAKKASQSSSSSSSSYSSSTQLVDNRKRTIEDSDGDVASVSNGPSLRQSDETQGDVCNLSFSNVASSDGREEINRKYDDGHVGFSSSLELRGFSSSGLTLDNRPEAVPYSSLEKLSSGNFGLATTPRKSDEFPNDTYPFSESNMLSTSMQMDGYGSGLISSRKDSLQPTTRMAGSIQEVSIKQSGSGELKGGSIVQKPTLSSSYSFSSPDASYRPSESSDYNVNTTRSDGFRPSSLQYTSGNRGSNGPSLTSGESNSRYPFESFQRPLFPVGNGAMPYVTDYSMPKQNDDFGTLEQHIEDLTQEKFSLQRDLDASRALAESLASDNSSITDTYNQQRSIVNQLKDEMEKLQQQIQAQMGVLESVRIEYANAQLECNAADERSQILASEVISLEDKALRLRSNELKLERQLESAQAELSSYKRKLQSLEKDHQNLQSTIKALQEEKKILQTMLQKASSGGKSISKSSSSRKNASTSTESLAVSDTMPESSNQETDSTALLESDSSNTTIIPETGQLTLEGFSLSVPSDQMRVIHNINTLIAELAIEKEELVQALSSELSQSAHVEELNKELSRKLEVQTQRLELLTAQNMATDSVLPATQPDSHVVQERTQIADEGDEVVERVLGWIMKMFPGGPSKRRTSKLL
ncbi:unnamed protein product [Cochlearia groenlandica]